MSNADTSRKILIITPVRNEQAFLQVTIDSVVAQRLRPKVWMIVDDGSTDATAEIVKKAASEHPWIRLYQRQDRGERKVGGGVVEAFKEGLEQFNLNQFDYLCKLDGDLQFGPDCFEKLVEKFEVHPKLGTASGKCFDKTQTGWEPLRTSDEFSLGACKFYRVACFQDIGGFVQEVMWDGIDCHRCRMQGWQAQSFHDEELRLYELRPMGTSHKSIFHGRFRWGYGQYYMGTHWLYLLAISAYRTFERPYGLGGLCILAGYLDALIRGKKRYHDLEFRRHLHRWQLAKLRLIR